MAILLSHPDGAQLQAFNQGRLEDETATTAIAAHLDTCVECRGKLETLSGDTLENLVRSADFVPLAGEPAGPIPEGLEYFRIVKVLGEGGMGTVYEADDTRLHRKVALKTLKRELAQKAGAKERFLREARAAAALEHDHVIPIYYVGEADGIPFLAMPLLKGMSLDEYLQRAGGQVSPAVCLHVGRQIAAGLAAAHRRGLIHRDIKPSNIWIEPEQGGRVKILDFGLAHSAGDEAHLTASGTIVGTPAYMAPEQARGKRIGARADLFSLGCVLYEMVTGRRPFCGQDTMAILTSLAVDIPAPPHTLNPQCSPELSALVMKLLENNPAARPESAGAVIEALARLSPVEPLSLWAATDQTAVLGNPWAGINEAGATRSPNEKAAVPATPSTPHKLHRRIAVAAAALFVLAPLAIFSGGTVIRYAYNQGELVIQIDDKDVEVRVVQNGVVVKDKPSQREFTLTAGTGEIEVLEKDGVKLATKKFELTRGGNTTVTVTWAELTHARKSKTDPDPDPDRRAAEYVLSIGGTINIRVDGGEERNITVDRLPKERFQLEKPFLLTSVQLQNNPKVTEAGLAHFKGCKNLTDLRLNGTGVTDSGLAHFKDCKNLTLLQLVDTGVTDVGLAHFKDCKNLTRIHLFRARVTEAGLAHFKDCKNLTELRLNGTGVTEAGLAHFKGCKNLTELDLRYTGAKKDDIAALKEALPQCRITWDDGVIEPTKK